MFASRSDVLVRIKPYRWIAAASFGFFLVASLLLPAPEAFGATSAAKKARAKAVADSLARGGSSDEGISVRVIEDGKQTTSKSTRSHHTTTKATDEDGDEVDTPDVPDRPDAPEPPHAPDDNSNDLVRFGQDIIIPAGKVIDGDVVAIGGSITVFGRVKGSCTAVGGSVSVRDKGAIEGDAVSVGGSTTESDSANVAGSNVSVGGWPFKGHHGVIPILGIMGLGAIAGIFTTIIQYLLTIFFAWLALMLARERIENAVDRMGHDFGKSLLWGLVGWMSMIVAIPAIAVVSLIAMVILVITIIGIPVAILLAIVMVFALIAAVLGIIVATFLAYMNGAMYLGRRIHARRSPGVAISPIHAVIVGTLVILGLKLLAGVLSLIGLVFVMPLGIALGIMGGVLLVIFSTAGLGAMIMTRFSKGFVAGAGVPPAPAGEGWYSPPPPPPPSPQPPSHPLGPEPPPAGGSSDAP